MSRVSLLLFALLLIGCDGPMQEPTTFDLPQRLVLTGTATGSDASGLTGDCHLDFLVHEQGLFAGTIDEQGYGAGTWTCAPLDLNQDGYVDTTLSLQGSWHVEPEATTP